MAIKKNYTQLRSELEQIIKWFESEDIDIDQAIGKYEEALGLVKDIEKYLKEAENKLSELKTKRK